MNTLLKKILLLCILIILFTFFIVTCHSQITTKDSLMINKINIRISELQKDMQRVIEQKKQLEESVLRIEGALFILNEQRNEEIKRLDSLNVKKTP